MGTRKTSRDTKKINCKTCNKEYTPMCDFMQGRCPYHSAFVDTLQFRTRLTNLINFFKGNK